MNFIKPKKSSEHSDSNSLNNGGTVSLVGRGSTPEQMLNNKNTKSPGEDFQGINVEHKDVRINSFSYTP